MIDTASSAVSAVIEASSSLSCRAKNVVTLRRERGVMAHWCGVGGGDVREEESVMRWIVKFRFSRQFVSVMPLIYWLNKSESESSAHVPPERSPKWNGMQLDAALPHWLSKGITERWAFQDTQFAFPFAKTYIYHTKIIIEQASYWKRNILNKFHVLSVY